MDYGYQNSYIEEESAEEEFSYSSMGHMGNNGCHNNQLGFGNGMGHHQMGGYSNHGLPNSGYGGMGKHHGHGYNNHHNHNHNHNNNHSSGLKMASSYEMNEESNFYSAQNSYYPPKRYF